MCHKPFVMTRSTILTTIFILLAFVIWPKPVKSATRAAVVIEHAIGATALAIPDNAMTQPVSAMSMPFTSHKAKQQKHHLMKIEELGKVHRFRKDRVKKVKKHGDKYWLAIKILIVFCHISLLIHAFMHLTH